MKVDILGHSRIYPFFLLLVFFAIALAAVWQFGINGDEGQYLYESRLYAEDGLLPISDYYASNPPLFYILYGLFMSVFGYTFEMGRILSVLFYSGSMLLVYAIAKQMVRSEKQAFFVVLIFMSNWVYFRNNIIMKHYAPSNFFMLASISVLLLRLDFLRDGIFRSLFWAGMLWGTAFNIRMHLVFGLAPFVSLWIFVSSWNSRRSIRQAFFHFLFFFAGILVVCLPLIFISLVHYDEFVFSYFTYPFTISGGGERTPDPKWWVIPEFFWTGAAKQNLLLVIFSEIGLIYALMKKQGIERQRYVLIGIMAVMTLVIYSASPVTVGSGHFAQSIPYWTLLLIPLLQRAISLSRRVKFAVMVPAGTAFMLLFLTRPLPKLLTTSNRNLPTHGSIGTFNTLGREVSKIIKPREEIIDWVCGAAFLSGARNVRGFEQGYAVSMVFNQIPDDGFINPPMISKKQFVDVIENQRVGVIIVSEYDEENVTAPEFRRLVSKHYNLYKDIYHNVIYVSDAKLAEIKEKSL